MNTQQVRVFVMGMALLTGCSKQPKGTNSPDDTPAASGGSSPQSEAFDREAIDREVQARLVDVRACYDSLPDHRSDLEGRLTSRFLINDQGRATDLELESETLDDPALESCVAGVLRSIEFPPAPAGEVIAVTYPFEFRTE